MPLHLEFDYRFSRAIKERLKRQCFTPFAYFTVLSEAAAVPVPHLENTETIYKLMACLQEDVSVGMKRVKAKVFVQDPFNPVLFTENTERYVDVSNIVCAL